MTPEFSRPVAADGIPSGGRSIEVEAGPAERAALAQRFRLPEIESLRCGFVLTPGFGGVIAAVGTLVARVTQSCVVSLDDFASEVTERFELRFVPAGRESFDADPETPDEIAIESGRIDLGEAAAEQLALALDPYPRKPGLPGDDGPAEARSPFAALAALRKRPD